MNYKKLIFIISLLIMLISVIISFLIPNLYFIPFLFTFPISCCSSRINSQDEENDIDNNRYRRDSSLREERKKNISKKKSQAPNECNICGFSNKINSRYCSRCGRKL